MLHPRGKSGSQPLAEARKPMSPRLMVTAGMASAIRAGRIQAGDSAPLGAGGILASGYAFPGERERMTKTCETA